MVDLVEINTTHTRRMVGQLLESNARIERTLHLILGALTGAAKVGEEIMADLSNINSAIATLTADVTAQTTVEQSVVTLINGQVQQLNALQAQIAALQAGTVTQAQLDGIASQISAQATALTNNTAALAAAVPANTTPPAPPASS